MGVCSIVPSILWGSAPLLHHSCGNLFHYWLILWEYYPLFYHSYGKSAPLLMWESVPLFRRSCGSLFHYFNAPLGVYSITPSLMWESGTLLHHSCWNLFYFSITRWPKKFLLVFKSPTPPLNTFSPRYVNFLSSVHFSCDFEDLPAQVQQHSSEFKDRNFLLAGEPLLTIPYTKLYIFLKSTVRYRSY